MIITTTIASIIVVCSIILFLVSLLLIASSKLQPQGEVKISINDGSDSILVKPGTSLLSALSSKNIYLPSACGGGGTCAVCKCQVVDGGGGVGWQSQYRQLIDQQIKKAAKRICGASIGRSHFSFVALRGDD